MHSPCKTAAFAVLVFTNAALATDPVVVKERDVLFPGFFGLGRKVESETLILPDASSVMRRQRVRDRYVAMRDARGAAEREQQRQAESRRQAEAAAMSKAAPAPADAASAEAAMVEASVEPVPEETATVAEPAATEAPAAVVEPVPETAPAASAGDSSGAAPDAPAPGVTPAEASPAAE